ncbi:MAG: SGNH/GDSL hydrolase family protein [Paludibacter sp.]|nr:SGNH/GDSL hydrolase family protein [Paludibacter sp.]
MKKKQLVGLVALFITIFNGYAQQSSDAPKVKIGEKEKTLNSQWKGRRVAFLGDSMTDKRRIGTTCIYWEYLTELLGIEPYIYAHGGDQWNSIYKQAEKLKEERNDNIDAIIIFAGTNDYNGGIPMGNFYSETIRSVNSNGQIVKRKYRTPVINDSTFCGRINRAISYLKNNFPKQQIIIMTPIHRGYANFNERNIQPDEYYANGQGLFIDDYVNALKQAANNWAVPVIDLYSISGLYPMSDSYSQYFHNAETDMLHPNANGDYRLAKTIQYQLLALPSTFVL